MKAKRGLLALLCILAVCLSGCGVFSKFTGRSGEKSADEDTSSGYHIYYINKDGTALYPYSYKLTETSESGIISECMNMLSHVPDGEDCQPIFTDELKPSDYNYDSEGKILTLYFDSAYTDLDDARKMLVRTAVVKTMTQFYGLIDYVRFNIDGEWLVNDDGEIMLMKNSDYVISLPTDQSQLEDADLILYFASLDGTGLVAVSADQKYDPATSLEQVVLDNLIRGPVTSDCQEVLSQNTQVKDVYVSEGICYVDFNKAFLETVGDQSFLINVYSVVNSLTALEEVEGVVITVDGEKVDNAPEGVDISGVLTARTDLVVER